MFHFDFGFAYYFMMLMILYDLDAFYCYFIIFIIVNICLLNLYVNYLYCLGKMIAFLFLEVSVNLQHYQNLKMNLIIS